MTLTEFSTWYIGFTLYAEGHDIEACANETERKGWYTALRGKETCDDMDAWVSAGRPLAEYVENPNYQDGMTYEDYATAWQG